MNNTMEFDRVEINMVIFHVVLENLTDFVSRCPAQPGGTENTPILGCQVDLGRSGHFSIKWDAGFLESLNKVTRMILSLDSKNGNEHDIYNG